MEYRYTRGKSTYRLYRYSRYRIFLYRWNPCLVRLLTFVQRNKRLQRGDATTYWRGPTEKNRRWHFRGGGRGIYYTFRSYPSLGMLPNIYKIHKIQTNCNFKHTNYSLKKLFTNLSTLSSRFGSNSK